MLAEGQKQTQDEIQGKKHISVSFDGTTRLDELLERHVTVYHVYDVGGSCLNKILSTTVKSKIYCQHRKAR